LGAVVRLLCNRLCATASQIVIAEFSPRRSAMSWTTVPDCFRFRMGNSFA
jgi:hypothetical protein